MPAPVPAEQRAAVLEAARSGASRNEVARRTGVSASTVTRICKAAGVSFDRSRTAVAVQARVIDLKAARVHLAGGLLDDIAEARSRLHQADDPREFFDLARSVGVLVNAHVRIVAVDGTEAGVEQAKGMLGSLAEALGVVYQSTYKEPEDGEQPALPAGEAGAL